MTYLEEPWQTRAGHPGTATRSARRRQPLAPAIALDHDETTPRWYRPAFLVMLATVAVLYLWDLTASGYGNTFYAAAVQAGTESWKAWFFGSLDSSSFITVDKPPASLWIMGLSGRIFGFNSWSLLVPQALEGIAAAGLLCATVRRAIRRVAGGKAAAVAGLIAGMVMALTPAAVLIFRFDNPDALMVLLVVVAGYCVVRALERGRTWWLAGAGVAFGFGFLTKSGEALLNVPAFALAYLVAAPVPFWRRVWQLLEFGLAIVASAGWWIAAVLLTPAADRPYIGGSGDNNPLGVAFGYNGFGRLLGGEGNGGGGGSGFGGTPGVLRLFSGEFGLEVSWLLPASVVLLLGAIWVTWRAPRTDPARASLIIFGGWLVSTGLTFAYMKGTIHPYYTVALAPAIGALVGIGAVLLCRQRAARAPVVNGLLALTVAVTCGWGFELLHTDSSFHPSVKYLEVAAAVAAVFLLGATAFWFRSRRPVLVAAAALAAAAVAIPATAWALGTAATPHSGSIPTAVSGSSDAGFSAGSSGGGPGGGFAGFRSAASTGRAGAGPGGTAGFGPDGASGTPEGLNRQMGANPGVGTSGERVAGSTAGNPGAGGTRGNPGAGGGMGGAGFGGTSTSSALVKALEKTTTRWAAAVTGSQSAAQLELASGGKAVMAMGGFTGSDPAPTLADFEQWVKAGDITYYIAGSTGGGPGGQGGFSQITAWVEAHYKSATIGGQTVYLLLEPK
jgi:4-amino-4-deoxy-L-arabinose transferase-like glycosyltransferase